MGGRTWEATVSERIGVGVVGLGFIGPFHIDAVRRLGYAEVVAVCGSSEAKGRQAAERLAVARGYGDWRALVDDPEVQVVHVCTPNDTHYPIARAALLAGKHVVCEKPLAMDSRQSAELVALARERGRVNAVAFTYLGYPLVKEARAMVARGDLGEVQLVHGGYLQDWLLFPTDYNWRVEAELSGASRAIADIGTHWFTLVEYVTGLRVRRVMARLKTFLPTRQRPRGGALAFQRVEGVETEEVPVTTEDCGMLWLELANGALATGLISQVSAGRKCMLNIEVNGSQGSVFWNQEQPDQCWIGRRDRPNQILFRDPNRLAPTARWAARLPIGHPEGWPDALRACFEPAYRQIREGAPMAGTDYPDFSVGHRAMRFVEAVLQSHAEERWVVLAD